MIKETQNFSFKVRNIEIWNNPNYFSSQFCGEKTIYYIIGIGVIGIGIGRYENYYIGILSVSADIEKSLSVVHCTKMTSSKMENKLDQYLP